LLRRSSRWVRRRGLFRRFLGRVSSSQFRKLGLQIVQLILLVAQIGLQVVEPLLAAKVVLVIRIAVIRIAVQGKLALQQV